MTLQENYRPIFNMNINIKLFNISISNPATHTQNNTQDQVSFTPNARHVQYSKISHIGILKKKNMIYQLIQKKHTTKFNTHS